MIDVTEIVHRYRLALRHIWNTCFWVDPDLRNYDSIDFHEKLKPPLFAAIVAGPLGIQTEGQIFGNGFQIVPKVASKEGPVLPSLLVKRSEPPYVTWKELVGPFKACELSLTLLDFFDWSPMSYMDLRYYRVRIETFVQNPDLTGQDALVDVVNADVFWTVTTQTSPII